jgi:hypothetical protein
MSASHRSGAIHTSEPPLLSVSRPDTSSSGDYRCYQHGCEGRQFSSAENYRRHIRERNQSNRTTCPFCAAVFTRKSNRDTHVREGRCKAFNRWSSEQISILSNSEALPEGTHDATNVGQAWAMQLVEGYDIYRATFLDKRQQVEYVINVCARVNTPGLSKLDITIVGQEWLHRL